MKEKNNNRVEEFMDRSGTEIDKYFTGHSQVLALELKTTLQGLTSYLVTIFRPVEEALSLMENTILLFLSNFKDKKWDLDEQNLQEDFSNLFWEKTVEHCVKKYKKELINYSRQKLLSKHMAEDVVQDSFRKLSLLKPGEIKTDIKSWLYTTSRNRAYDLNKKCERRSSLENNLIDASFKSEVSSPDDILELKDDYNSLIFFLEKHLNSTQMKLLKLKFEQQLSAKEIAKRLNLSDNYVRKAICLTLMSIRKKMNERN